MTFVIYCIDSVKFLLNDPKKACISRNISLFYISLSNYSQTLVCMRNILLFFVFMVLTIGLYAQSNSNSDLLATNYNRQSISTPAQLQIFPNPAMNYIGVTNNNEAKQIVVYNLVGRKMKSFMAVDGETYFVGDLKRGMYLVQILGANNKVITTQRVSKK